MAQLFLSVPQVMERYGVAARATIYRWIHKQGFPRPVRLTGNCSRFPLEEIEAWEQARRDARPDQALREVSGVPHEDN